MTSYVALQSSLVAMRACCQDRSLGQYRFFLISLDRKDVDDFFVIGVSRVLVSEVGKAFECSSMRKPQGDGQKVYHSARPSPASIVPQ